MKTMIRENASKTGPLIIRIACPSRTTSEVERLRSPSSVQSEDLLPVIEYQTLLVMLQSIKSIFDG